MPDGAHNLSATAVDRAGNTSTASGPLSLTIDTTAAVVAQTTASPANGTKMPGDTVVVTIKLNEAVTVAGTPALLLNDGGKATYLAGSGTDTLTFSYTVAATDAQRFGVGDCFGQPAEWRDDFRRRRQRRRPGRRACDLPGPADRPADRAGDDEDLES